MQQTNTSLATNPAQKFNWADFLSFRKMIALQIMQILYVVVAALITLFGLMLLFKGEDRGYGSESLLPGGLGTGLAVLIFGNVFWRLWCEFMIVLFRINKTLTNIDDNTRKQMLS